MEISAILDLMYNNFIKIENNKGYIMKINRVSYELLEETISLYISFNKFEEEDIIVRFMGDKKENINNLEDYLNNPIKNENNYYRVFIKLVPAQDNYINYSEPTEIVNKKIEQAKIMLDDVLNDFFIKIPIIKSISSFQLDPNTNYEDEDELYTDGLIITTEDLIIYLTNKLMEKNINIVQETYKNYEDENQLCHRI